MNYKNLHITMTKKRREHPIEMIPAAMPIYTHENAYPYPLHACGTPYKGDKIEKNCGIKKFSVDKLLKNYSNAQKFF